MCGENSRYCVTVMKNGMQRIHFRVDFIDDFEVSRPYSVRLRIWEIRRITEILNNRIYDMDQEGMLVEI